MVGEYSYDTPVPIVPAMITCMECNTLLGGDLGKDPYSHLLGCLNVEPNALHRIKSVAMAKGNENGRHILHIVNFLLGEE